MDKLRFQAILLNTKFDRSYKNVLRFENREAQEEYFKLSSLFLTAQPINFNAGSLVETFIFYNKKENENLNDLLSKNYCIIKDNNENATLKYYFYFVKDAMQDSATQIKLRLELDIFQTYYIDLNFTPCNIHKAHLNRFVDAGNGKVKFDDGIDSKLFEREDVKNVAKRLTKRTKCDLYSAISNSDVRNWLNSNVACWLYIFLDPNKTLKNWNGGDLIITRASILPKNYTSKESGTLSETDSFFNFNILCLPIFNKKTEMRINGKSVLNYLSDIRSQNKDLDEFIYAKKLSKYPPFQFLKTDSDIQYSISSDDILEINVESSRVFKNTFGTEYEDFHDGACVLFISRQIAGVESQPVELSDEIEFQKEDIINSNKSYRFNPKLLSIDFKELRITDETAQSFSLDIQKLNTKSIKLKYIEPLSPDITRAYGFISNLKEDGIYSSLTNENFTGFVSQNDNSVPIISTEFQKMLANSKNYFLQNTVNRFENLFGGITSAGINAVKGNVYGAIQGSVGAGFGFISSLINQQLSVDNMKNAPSEVQNAKGSVYLNLQTTDMGVFVEEYDILPNEKNIINDYMCLYGFTANFVDDLKKYDNIRKFYNYIQAEIEETTGINISNAVHDKFRQAFRDGVRFWNSDDFQFEKENYERWLENE